MAKSDLATRSRRGSRDATDDGHADANGVSDAMADVKSEDAAKHNGHLNGHSSIHDPLTTNGTSFKRSPSSSEEPFQPYDASRPDIKNESRSISSSSRSPSKPKSFSRTQTPASYTEEVVGGDMVLKKEGKDLKLSRSSTRKVQSRPAPLFLDEMDVSEEACASFTVIAGCEYQNKHIGQTEGDMDLDEIECECEQSWDPTVQINNACGEDSDCINRATKIECIGDCRCGAGCQNRRFQLKQYATVTVFHAGKKGYGLRADTDLKPNDFIFEYLGEVISEAPFQRRRTQYDKENIKHFYFMSLSKGEFIDATKKGNLGRFCNHSCNPNCYVDKWVVSDKLRMGIFAMRPIKAGEELTFDYNVDRYGADPQPCYCGEPNCSGFLGGKTQTDKGTRLAHDVVEALGIEDGDDWDMATHKKQKKRKTGEVDEEFVDKVKPRQLEEDVVSKVMSQLMQKKEKWIVVKLLQRIQTAASETVFARVVKMHGYRILKSILSTFLADANVCLQVFDILGRLPRLTKNKIHDSKIEEVVQRVQTDSDDDKVKEEAASILGTWNKLEMGYRIPKRLRDANEASSTPPLYDDRRGRQKRQRSESRSPSPQRIQAPTGPKNMNHSTPRGPGNFRAPSFATSRPPPSAPSGPRAQLQQQQQAQLTGLPDGWTEIYDKTTGKPYYFSADGQTSWTKPVLAANIPPPPPKPLSESERLQLIINECITQGIQAPAALLAASAVHSPMEKESPATSERNGEKQRKEWGDWPIDKCKKHYKGVIAPIASRLASKYKDTIPKDRLKDWIKEITNHITERHFTKDIARNVKELPRDLRKKTEIQIREFFDKAAKKSERHRVASDARRRSLDVGSGGVGVDGELGTGIATPAEGGDLHALEDAFKSQDDGANTTATAIDAPPPPPPPPVLDDEQQDADPDAEANFLAATSQGNAEAGVEVSQNHLDHGVEDTNGDGEGEMDLEESP